MTDGTYIAAVETGSDFLTTLHISSGITVNSMHLGMDDLTNSAVGVPALSAPSGLASNIASLASANVGRILCQPGDDQQPRWFVLLHQLHEAAAPSSGAPTSPSGSGTTRAST